MTYNIRWMGAFANQSVKRSSREITKSLEWEFGEGLNRERAAEMVKFPRSKIRSPVGLIYENEAIKRFFPRDTWSETRKNKCLKRGKVNPHSDHNELWLKKGICPYAIVYKRAYIKSSVLTSLKQWCESKNIPLVEWGQIGVLRK